MSLRLKLFFLLFLFFFFNTVNGGYDKTVECSQTNSPEFILESNTVTLFQSPKFPQTIGNNSSPSSCDANFTVAAGVNNNIWIVMLNGVITEMQFYDAHNMSNELTKQKFNSNFDVVNFTTSSNGLIFKAFAYESETAWAAFQAIVIPYPQNFQGCPLESKTFDFSTDPNFVIPITPTFLLPDIELSYKLCNWFFTISPNHQLKVVVRRIFEFDKNITVALNNEKGLIYSFSDNDLDQVFYFDGQKFTIMYQFYYANFSNTGFLIFVSAVAKPISFTANGCQPPAVNSTTNIITYSNIDYVNGYPPNQKCVNPLNIPINHEATLSVVEYDFEGISDKLSVNFGKNSSNLITWTTWKTPINYKITSDISGGELIFLSDGNIQGAGYRATLEPYECQCADADFVFHCDFNSYLRPMTGNYPYCSNMNCIYKISPNETCPEAYFSLSLENTMRKSIDYMTIAENGITLQNITEIEGDSDFNFAPKSNVTVHFVSGASANPITDEDKMWYIEVKPMPKPKFTKVAFDQTTSKYVKWLADMHQNDALIVCSLTGTLEIFIPHLVNVYDLRDYFLYDSEDLSNFVGSLNSIAETSSSNTTTNPINKKSASGCFTLYLRDNFPFDNDYYILFQNVDDSKKNCRDSNNVFQIPPTSTSNFDVTVESTKDGSCEMIILSSHYNSMPLSRIWISDISVSDNEGQYSVYSAENGKELFSFKGSDAYKWINFGVYTPALSVTAPPSASITISMSGAYQALEIIKVLPNVIQSGIMASPSYSGFKQIFGLQSIYKSSGSTKFSTVFQVKEINGDAKPILEYESKNTTLTIGTFVVSNEFTLYYAETDPSKNGFMIEYIINSCTEQTDGSSTTMKTPIPSSSTTPADTSTQTPITASTATPITSITNSLTSTSTRTSSSTTKSSTTPQNSAKISILEAPMIFLSIIFTVLLFH